MMSMSSFLAVRRISLIIVIILSSTACIVLLTSMRSVCNDLISVMAFLLLESMFCSTRSIFLRSSPYRSSPILTLAAMVFICSVMPPMSGAGGGVFAANSPLLAGAAGAGASVPYAIASSAMLNV